MVKQSAWVSVLVLLTACSPQLGPPAAKDSAVASPASAAAPDEALAQGFAAWEHGDTDKALSIFRTLNAVGALRPRAEAGDPHAQVALGRIAANSGAADGRVEAEKLYRLAADRGDPDGLNSLGKILRLPAETALVIKAQAVEPVGIAAIRRKAV